jgi:hypothetical protein
VFLAICCSLLIVVHVEGERCSVYGGAFSGVGGVLSDCLAHE